MDLKNNKRSIIGLLIITVIVGFLAVVAVSRMDFGIKDDGKIKKTDYMLLLEKELEIEFNSEDDFVNFATINYDLVVEPTKYKYYYKPCFDFVIVSDGVIITNQLSKEFDEFGFEAGMKITKINDSVLAGKTYFEILDLLYSKKLDDEKEFTLSDGTKITYKYQNYYSTYEYNVEENTLYLYNLDNLTAKGIYDLVNTYKDVKLDLSKATVTTYDGVVNFLSLFSYKNEVLFKTPEGVIGQKGRKIDSININVKDNNDEGILFVLTCIKNLNSNINIDKKDLNTTKFYALKELEGSSCTVYLKNYLLETNSNSSGETVI